MQRGAAAVRERKRMRKAETGERDSRRHVGKLKRENTTRQATEIEDVANKLSETRKVKPVSAV